MSSETKFFSFVEHLGKLRSTKVPINGEGQLLAAAHGNIQRHAACRLGGFLHNLCCRLRIHLDQTPHSGKQVVGALSQLSMQKPSEIFVFWQS